MPGARRAERPVWLQQHERAMGEAGKALQAPRPDLLRFTGSIRWAVPACGGGAAGTQRSHVQADWGDD